MPRGILSRRLFLGQTFASIMTLPAGATAPALRDGFHTLEAREGKLMLLPQPAAPTNIWGYDGTVPGPLLRFKKGEEVNARLVNNLPQPTSLNWHGVRISNPMDGVTGLTQEPVPPGGTFDYRFTPPDSGLYWYHPHALPFLDEQLERGLYGVMIIDEPEPPLADRDMLVVLSDWALDDKGQIKNFDMLSDAIPADRSRPFVTVNADAVPIEEMLPPSSRLRLRIVNAANTQLMVITFFGVTPSVVAIDSQPCEAFEPAKNMIPLGPGARFDVILDLPNNPGADASLRLLGDNEPSRILLAFKTAGDKRPPLPPIASLPPNPLLPAVIKLETSHKFNISIETIASAGADPSPQTARNQPNHWKLNGKVYDGLTPSPLFSVKRGTPVTLGFVNKAGFVQAMHVHGHVTRLLHDLDDGWEPYWRDTILIPEGKTKHVAFVADNPGNWAIECFMTGRHAKAMVTWFEVT
jgi:FtsP/CotA-like multicopper oxidase with cupredoxin domain